MKTSTKEVNRIKTLFVHNPAAKCGSVQFWFKAGSALETSQEQGIAHFLEHMFFKGSEKRPGSSIAHEIESYGGEVNAFTSFDYTCYYINTPAQNLTQSLDILMDMVCNPQFLKEDILTERDVVLEEYKRALDSPAQYGFFQMQSNSFQGSYQHPILGTPDHINHFNQKQLNSFRSRFYNQQNSIVVIAGPIDDQTQYEEIIKNYHLPSGDKSLFSNFTLKQTKQNIFHHHTDITHIALSILIHAPDYQEEQAAIEDIALHALAQGETSRLYNPLVREKAIASGLSASTMFFNKDGLHFIKLVFPVENTAKVLNLLLQEIQRVLKTPIANEEVQKIKNQYVATKVYERESIESLAFSYGHSFAQTGDIHSEDQFIERIKKVTPAQAHKAIFKILAQKKHYHLQLPRSIKAQPHLKEVQKFQTQLDRLIQSKKTKANSYKTQKSSFDPSVQLLQIKPGIRLLYRHNPQTPTFILHAYLKGGLTKENKNNNGLHYLISRCLTFGHAQCDYLELKNKLDFKSASLSGFSGKNAYGLTLHAQSEHFSELADDFFLTLMQPKLPNRFFLNEKKLIQRALKNMMEDPLKRCFQLFNRYIFKNHPYQNDLIGTAESLKKIKISQLKKTHQSHLAKDELLITYCGDQNLDEVLPLIEKHLSSLKPRKETKTKAIKIKAKPQLLPLEFDRAQTQIFMGYPAFSMQDRNDLYLKMFTQYLSGQSSDLFVEIRDKRSLCYAVQAVHHNALEAGYWGIYIGTSNEKRDIAITEIAKLLRKIALQGLSSSQFDRLKKMILGSSVLNLQTNEDYANYYSIPTLHHLGIDFEKKKELAIKQASVSDFNAFLKKFFKQKPIVTIVGETKGTPSF